MSENNALSRPVISIKGLTKVFHLGKEKVVALNGIDLDVYENEIVCLLGTSGSGKSTLLNMMAGLEKPSKGTVTIFGERIDKMSERKLAKFRQKNMGFVFQSYNLLPNLNAIDNVALPLAFAGVKKRIRNKKARQILKLVGLGKRMRHKPTQMSGGQQQRVGIARAFVGTPKIVFADEPTGNLDTRTTIEIMEMMVGMSRQNHQTLVIVTHDIEIAAYADKIYHIIDGHISSVEDNRDKQIVPGRQDAETAMAEAESKAAEVAEAETEAIRAEAENAYPKIREGVKSPPDNNNDNNNDPDEPLIEPIPENSAPESAADDENRITEILRDSELGTEIHTTEE